MLIPSVLMFNEIISEKSLYHSTVFPHSLTNTLNINLFSVLFDVRLENTVICVVDGNKINFCFSKIRSKDIVYIEMV